MHLSISVLLADLVAYLTCTKDVYLNLLEYSGKQNRVSN